MNSTARSTPFQRAHPLLAASRSLTAAISPLRLLHVRDDDLPSEERRLLTLEELDRLCSAFIRLGVEKLRITRGGSLWSDGIS